MALTEHTINDALAVALRRTRHVWKGSAINAENTGMLKGSSGRPDILVTETNVSPVVIETEVIPALTVEQDALSRLGKKVRGTGRPLLSSIAVRMPKRWRTAAPSALSIAIGEASDLQMALYTGMSPSDAERWPKSGWINGTVDDLSILTQAASVPPAVIEDATNHLVSGVIEAAGLLDEMAASNPGAVHKISEKLRQEDGEQTLRMATTIMANAFVFHDTLAGGPGELDAVRSLDELRGVHGLRKSTVLAEWRKILKVNYWPIFDIARRILEVIPASYSNPLLERLADTAAKLLENRLMRSHDLTGAVFQRMIADRKFLAAFYTAPASAAFLTGLAIPDEEPPGGGAWDDPEAVRNLRIADFACGTGTLLTTAYQRISQLHELAGGDAERLHPDMMAQSLIGCDVLPAASHLTASMLAGAHPTVKYRQSSILTLSYGKQQDGVPALGSLDLLDLQKPLEILNITAKTAEATGESERQTWSSLPTMEFDLVIMNPPFTRDTGHEGKKIGVSNPMFAAFSFSKEDQKLMAGATKLLTKGTSAVGNAGEASIFLVLGDRMMKTGGTLALVMPLSLVSGDAWEKSRLLLRKSYTDIVVASIAGTQNAELSFSADTGMGECLITGRKSKYGSPRATFIVLNERPAFPMLGASAARQVRDLMAEGQLRRLEDGPVGGTDIRFGNDIVGQVLDAPLPASGGWKLSRVSDLSLAQASHQIAEEHRLWLPGIAQSTAVKLPVTTVGAIGKIGPYHADVVGRTASGAIRGPFERREIQQDAAPTYPILWAHDAEREQKLSFQADSEGIPCQAPTRAKQEIVDQRVAAVWATASHCHFNQNFQFNSQSTAMQYSPRRTIGGRAWLSIRLRTVDHEKALVLWGNTSIGLLLHWWHSNKQQVGRGNIGKSSLQGLHILDVTALKPKRLAAASKLFNQIRKKPLLPLHQIDKDPTRKELDTKFAREVLGLPTKFHGAEGALELLRMKLAREPSVLGSKAE